MERIGDYVVLRLLGSGGMGSVYLARSRSERLVAIKVIRPEYAADPRFRERFRQEVEAARKVGGFHTAAVVDADPDAVQPWMASAYIEGPTLQAEVARRERLSEGELWRLTAVLAEALAAIHRHGLVHRDLKPSNIVLASDGPRVLDFGVARVVEETRLTTDGVVVGTAGFHSPEQALGRAVTGASDVFALGAVLVAASGGSAFGHGEPTALMFRVVHEEPDVSTVPPSLRPLVLACLAKDPSGRPTPLELLDLCAAHAGAAAAPGHDATVVDDGPPPAHMAPPPPRAAPPPSRTDPSQRPTETAPPNPSPALAMYLVDRSVWFLQVLRNVAGVAGLVALAVVGAQAQWPAWLVVVCAVAAFLLGVRLLGLLGAAKDNLTLNSRGIGLGPPNNLLVMPWNEIRSLELNRRPGWTDLTVRLSVVRSLPTGYHHPSWVRSDPADVIHIRTRRLTPVGTAPQLDASVQTFARWQRIRVTESQ
ncbi:serine/threonine-protein kinase [Streptomyces xanthii]|uniref:Serine/threonine protein kinase n=1 Tax=Streptomyces xanthii TaxID=2768069 RepID=A0A7H1BB98_9ACTN|nr:serine/threonine-protein kinase [Streptomyces xanthii]QNS06003.1 serine/threonine protein kinase [Streptomyces xanthii]